MVASPARQVGPRRHESLCTLRYSATHVDKHHMVYRLDAVDAYERKLVKQIEVAAATWRTRTTNLCARREG